MRKIKTSIGTPATIFTVYTLFRTVSNVLNSLEYVDRF